ncbi:hypothetical protein MKX01_037934 [Papaver californicum]|nr:hypothetical protein MKX01_037934 [Papaver californicum]
MDYSEDWKSLFTIGSVYCAPLLLPETPKVKSTLGPLLFSPSPGTQKTVVPYPCIPVQSDDFSSNNNLAFLKCPDNDILVFFLTGDNLCRLRHVKLSLKGDEKPAIYDTSDCEFESSRIVKIMVSSVYDAAASASAAAFFAVHEGFGLAPVPGSSFPLGFLLACTTYSVHWFRIDWAGKKHVLVNLGSERFSASVVHACWSPHVDDESLVLLDGGELILFDFSEDDGERTSLDVVWKDSDSGSLTSGTRWLGCEFGSHPRIFVIACSDIVYQVDSRLFNKNSASILAKIELFADSQSYRPEELFADMHEPDEFVTFCRAGSGGFNFSIASKYVLYLLDTRKPLSPLIQWAHNFDSKPTYMQVFKLSELRSKVEHNKYPWATQSGFAILLGSFCKNDFNLFIYGPPLPAPPKSIASVVSDLCHTLYAWGLPSSLSLSGCRCCSGDCLIREELSEARHPKKEIVGFCIVNEDLLDIHLEPAVGGSFVLIRLVSSGKFESQIYNASWEYDDSLIEPVEPALSTNEVLRMDSFQRYKIDRIFKYWKLDYLFSYLTGDLLAKILKEGSGCTQSFTQEKYKYLHDHLKAAGVDQIGSLPDIAKVLTSVSVPMSINEIAVSRMWTGLSIGALQLGFSSYPDLPQIKLQGLEVFMDFLRIPKSSQLPPFILRKPSARNKKSQKVQPDYDLLGPVLPLPVLFDLHMVENEINTSVADKKEVNEFSFENTLTHQCHDIMREVNVMGLTGSSDEFLDSLAVSLGDDQDENSSVSQEVKSLVFYKPTSFTRENRLSVDLPVSEDTSTAFIMKANKSNVEMFDDLCPIKLNFDSPIRNLGKEELEALKLLKRRISAWQGKFKPYQDLVGRPSMKG